MLMQFILFLPCFISAAAAVVCSFIRKKYLSRYFVMTAIVCAVYFFVDAGYISLSSDYRTMITLDLIGQYSVHCIAPCCCIYVFYEWRRRWPNINVWFSFIPAIIITTLCFAFMLVAGRTAIQEFYMSLDSTGHIPDNAPRQVLAYYYTATVASMSVLALELLIVTIHLVMFFVKSSREGLKDFRLRALIYTLLWTFAVSVVRLLLGRYYLAHHPGISMTLSSLTAVGILLFSYFHCTHYQSGTRVQVEDGPEPKVPSAEAQDNSADAGDAAASDNSNLLQQQFVAYMDEEQPFLDPELTLDDVAEHLNTNRTYVSLLMNRSFGVPFRDYINARRIEYSKTYMTEHPGERFESVAAACGFSSGAQFSRKFKEIVGMPPNVWVRTR